MDEQPVGEIQEKRSWFTRKIYETEAEKQKDFWIGVGLLFGLNLVLFLFGWAALLLLGSSSVTFPGSDSPLGDLYTSLACVLQLLPWLINFGLIIYFALTRSQIALGMVAGFGAALVIVICLGAIF